MTAVRDNLEPSDLVTPAEAAKMLDVHPSTLRTWIQRSEPRVEPLGTIGRWPAYDYNELARLERDRRRGSKAA